MFIPVETAPSVGGRPHTSKIAASDWKILADFWYPVAISARLEDKPLSATLLDVDLVVFRGAEDRIAVAVDLCPHRHIRLSGGQMVDGLIECPFHGLRFDVEGRCRRVPALGRDARLPANYRVKTFPAKEAYGLIWTCVGDADRNPIPSFPALEAVDPSLLAFAEPMEWPISAPRQIENFADLAHLPFVHADTLGGDPGAQLKPGKIVHTKDAVTLHANYIETARDGAARPSTFTYRIVLPFALDFTTVADEDPAHAMRSCNIAAPTSAYTSRVYQITRMDDATPEQRQSLVEALDVVNKQDLSVLSGLVIPDLPLDQRHEIHLPVDNIAHAFRSRLRELGLGARADTPTAA